MQKKNDVPKILIPMFIILDIILLAYALILNTGAFGVVVEKLLGNPSYNIIVIVFTIVLILLLILLIFVSIFMKNVKRKKIVVIKTEKSPIKEQSKQNAKKEEDVGKIERFCMLGEIDKKKAEIERVKYESNLSLKGLCEDFRNYASSELKLYYSIDDIRRFIAGMSVSHILILQGMSGTGKTSLAYAFGSFLDNPTTVIPVQPMWKERTDLIGYYNEFTKRFNETQLLQKMYEANYSKGIYVTVLDELNIARVEYYFAEFLSLLELPNPNDRYLDVVSDKWSTDPKQLKNGRIKLPENMWFIGTANNDDSTFAISDKVYDRAMIMNLDVKSERFIGANVGKKKVSFEKFTSLVKEALSEYDISQRNLKRLEELDKYLTNNFHVTFGNRIMKQIKSYIPVYIACGGNELDALDDILAKKVMRKLETQNPIYLRNSITGLMDCLDNLFGKDGMPLCKEFIRRLERSS